MHAHAIAIHYGIFQLNYLNRNSFWNNEADFILFVIIVIPKLYSVIAGKFLNYYEKHLIE